MHMDGWVEAPSLCKTIKLKLLLVNASVVTFNMATGDEEIDDLEYHVTFPAPTPSNDCESELELIQNVLRKKETAVMVIGWMGCKDQYLAKYSKIYEDIG